MARKNFVAAFDSKHIHSSTGYVICMLEERPIDSSISSYKSKGERINSETGKSQTADCLFIYLKEALNPVTWRLYKNSFECDDSWFAVINL